ncbi:hypothetical protein [Candidatus Spyradosoma sp. SGI.093]|uniref:hypothetical protein n=1 Tax=Candidatus Spyradosoma sp. SGI.093 TaxID=3420583 RepID=UPI003D055343
MRTLLTILASVSILVCAGCASGDGSKSPWSAGSKAKPAAQPASAPAAPAPAAAPAATCASAAEAAAPAECATCAPAEDAPLLAAYPALRQANKERALAEIEAAKAESAPLPTPDEGKARVVAYNTDCAVVQFDSGSAFKAGDRVVLSKSGAHALVSVISVLEGGRYIAEEVAGVIGAPMLVPGDEIDCVLWIDPEDVAAVAAAAEKAKANSDDATDAVADDEEEGEDEEMDEIEE